MFSISTGDEVLKSTGMESLTMKPDLRGITSVQSVYVQTYSKEVRASAPGGLN
jgi:hypothetical protein